MDAKDKKYTLRELGEINKDLWNNWIFVSNFYKQYGIKELILALRREKQSGNDIKLEKPLNVTIQEIEELKKIKDSEKRSLPLVIDIETANELTQQNLTELEQEFCINGIRIYDEGIINPGANLPISVQEYKKVREIIDGIKKKVFVSETISKNLREPFIALQVINQLAEMIQYDLVARDDAVNKDKATPRYKEACGVKGLITGLAVCMGYSKIAKNALACFGIESEILTNETHAWNQVKVNGDWYNLDLTFARKDLLEGKESTYIFMNDNLFYGEARKVNIGNGNGMVETVLCGGHNKDASRHDCPRMMFGFKSDQLSVTRLIKGFKKVSESFEKTGSCKGWQTYEQYEKKKEIKIGGESYGD